MNTKQVEEIQEKLEKYEEFLSKVLTEPKQIGIIEAGPFEHHPERMYKVKSGSGMIIVSCPDNLLYDSEHKDLKKGTEVMIIKGAIVAVTPQELVIEEPTPTFDLISWDDIGGLESQLKDIREVVEFPIIHSKLAKEMGLSPIKGVLLYGPPGCGKTMIAKAIASTILGGTTVSASAFTYVKGGELLSRYVGDTEQRIVNIFKRSRRYMAETGERAVIFIDEAEAIMPARGSRKSSDVETTIVPTFLAEMDGFEGNAPFVLLSTNIPENIDPAIIREGRIDLKVEISRPTHDDALDIFAIHLSRVKCSQSINELSTLGAEKLFAHPAVIRVSGAMIETVVKISAQKAMGRRVRNKAVKLGVSTEDILEAINTLL